MTANPQPSVLVVDDEADLRQLIAESLADRLRRRPGPDAADALERLKGFAYDALVVDLRLPDADGMEVLDAARRRYPDILPVMVTGFGGVTEAVSAMKRGAVDFLIKPFQIAQLSRVLKTASSSAASARRTPSCARSCATATASTPSSARARAMRRSLRPSSWSRR